MVPSDLQVNTDTAAYFLVFLFASEKYQADSIVEELGVILTSFIWALFRKMISSNNSTYIPINILLYNLIVPVFTRWVAWAFLSDLAGGML